MLCLVLLGRTSSLPPGGRSPLLLTPSHAESAPLYRKLKLLRVSLRSKHCQCMQLATEDIPLTVINIMLTLTTGVSTYLSLATLTTSVCAIFYKAISLSQYRAVKSGIARLEVRSSQSGE